MIGDVGVVLSVVAVDAAVRLLADDQGWTARRSRRDAVERPRLVPSAVAGADDDLGPVTGALPVGVEAHVCGARQSDRSEPACRVGHRPLLCGATIAGRCNDGSSLLKRAAYRQALRRLALDLQLAVSR